MINIKENKAPKLVDSVLQLLRPFHRYFTTSYQNSKWYIIADDKTFVNAGIKHYVPRSIISMWLILSMSGDPQFEDQPKLEAMQVRIVLSASVRSAEDEALLLDLLKVIKTYTKYFNNKDFTYGATNYYIVDGDYTKANAVVHMAKAIVNWLSHYSKKQGANKPIKPKMLKLAR